MITTLVVLAAPYLVMTNPPAGLAGPGKPVADRPPQTSQRGRARHLSQRAVARPRTGGPLPEGCGGGAAYLVM